MVPPADGAAPMDDAPLREAIARAASLVLQARYVIALTGAGISAESGIPTFRGKDGLWTRHGEPPMNQYQRFRSDPAAYWAAQRARRANPDALLHALAEAVPNDGHFALAELERLGIVRHTITQNVDDLHRLAGAAHLTEIHGNTAWVRCIDCEGRLPAADLQDERPVPRCPACGGILKTDAVMFGEPIPSTALRTGFAQAEQADCCLLVGTTAVVMPAAGFAYTVREQGGRLIEVNPEPTEISSACAVVIRAPAGEALPRLLAAVRERRAARPAGGS